MRHVESNADVGNASQCPDEESEIERIEDETIRGQSKSPSVNDRISTIRQQLMRPSTVKRTKLHFSRYISN
jgi:hypothetical protein